MRVKRVLLGMGRNETEDQIEGEQRESPSKTAKGDTFVVTDR